MKIQFLLLFILMVAQANAGTKEDLEAETLRGARLQNDERELNLSEKKKSIAASATAAAAATAAADGPKNWNGTKEECERAKSDSSVPSNEELSLSGSDGVRLCIKLSRGKFKELFRNGRRTGEVPWKENIIAFALNSSGFCAKKPNEREDVVTKYKKVAASCDGAAYLVSVMDRDWNSSEQATIEQVKGATTGMVCKSMGVETVDYEPCVKFASNADLMDVAQGAVQQGQQMYYADKTMSAQAEAMKDPNSTTGSLTALKETAKSQQDLLTQRAAMSTAKLAALATWYSDFPTIETLTEKCGQYPALEGYLAGLAGCTLAKNPDYKYGLLMNGPQKDKMKQKLVQVGVDVGSNAAMAALMGKRVGDINKAIAQVDSFAPLDPTGVVQDDASATYCQSNPGDPKCLTGNLDRTFDAIGDNVITFGGDATGVSYPGGNPLLDPTTGNTNAVNPTDRKAVTSVGTGIAGNNQKGGLASTVGAATITKGQPTGAGGGGAGGGGSMGGGGGGGGGTPGAGQPGGTSAAIQGKTPSYGGGGGSLSMMGGLGIRGKATGSGKDDGNPFSKLFNKPGSDKVLNFRGIASEKPGGKNDNLFEMITKRYNAVSTDKRLLEYELNK